MFYSTTYTSPVGTLTIACDSGKNGTFNLVGLWIAKQKYYGATIPEAMVERNDMPVFDIAKMWLDRYFAGEKPALTELPLSPIGSEFRQRVWRILCGIPYGEVMAYGDIAKKIAADMGRTGMSSQAVGQAVGHNPISIMIPCHRVVGSNGSLTGYAGGIQAKMKLLELEGVDMSRFFVPVKGSAL